MGTITRATQDGRPRGCVIRVSHCAGAFSVFEPLVNQKTETSPTTRIIMHFDQIMDRYIIDGAHIRSRFVAHVRPCLQSDMSKVGSRPYNTESGEWNTAIKSGDRVFQKIKKLRPDRHCHLYQFTIVNAGTFQSLVPNASPIYRPTNNRKQITPSTRFKPNNGSVPPNKVDIIK